MNLPGEDRVDQGFSAAQAFMKTEDRDRKMAHFREALEAWREVLSSGAEIPRAAFGIAFLCEKMAADMERRPGADGSAVDQYFQKAAEYYEKAAAMPEDGKLTPARASLALGRLYDRDKLPVPRGGNRFQMAFALMLAAAEAGLAEGQITVANWYNSGRGGETSYAKALEWMKKARDNAGQLSDKQKAGLATGITAIETSLMLEGIFHRPGGKQAIRPDGLTGPEPR